MKRRITFIVLHVYKHRSYYKMRGFAFFLFLFYLFSFSIACSVTHEELWKCMIEKAASYGRDCVTPQDIHREVKRNNPVILQPILLTLEGENYRRLYETCDVDENKCITYNEAVSENDCVRTCGWRQLVKSTVCS